MEFKQPIRHGRKASPVVKTPPTTTPHVPTQASEPEKPRRVQRLLSNKKILIITGLAVVVITGGGLFIRHHLATTAARLPKYQTVSPGGMPVDQLGGWKRVSPPEKDPVFAYADMIDGVSVSVSQQPLPISFKDDPAGKIAELAKSYSATNKIESDNVTIYIGTSVKGPQSVIFTKHNLLVLIKSTKKLSDASWTRYVGSLTDTGSATSDLPKY